MATLEEQKYVGELIERARKAQKIAEGYDQERVDHLVTAIVWNIVKPGTIEEISELAVEETELG
ncbi:MAG TPA: aldehyde dehydrogenase, partial [Tissierellales bacterium]|nr:aldehyde dehydrogenase [Tissierellales bacterium]